MTLYQQRSYARCISEGYGFLAKNVWKVCKVMTPYYIVFSLLLTLSNAVNTHANVSILANRPIKFEEVIIAVILTVLCVVAYITCLTKLYNFFKKECGIKGKHKIRWGKAIKATFRHLGKVIGTTLLSLFILVVLSLVVYIPYVVSMYAYFTSVEAQVNYGDMADIPTSGIALMIASCTICYTIINIVSVGFYASLMFLYGSVRGVKELKS